MRRAWLPLKKACGVDIAADEFGWAFDGKERRNLNLGMSMPPPPHTHTTHMKMRNKQIKEYKVWAGPASFCKVKNSIVVLYWGIFFVERCQNRVTTGYSLLFTSGKMGTIACVLPMTSVTV